MPEPTPGERAYTAYCALLRPHGWSSIGYNRLTPLIRAAWEAAAEAVRDEPQAVPGAFRYGLGACVRVAHGTRRFPIRARRWVEREILGPYAEYGLETPGASALYWEVEADLLAEEDDHA